MAVAAAPSRPDQAVSRGEGERTTDYARDVVEGRIVAGRLVRLACERHLRDLEQLDPEVYRFDAEVAGRAIRFFSIVLRHYKGEWGPMLGVRKEGLPIVLEDWEAFVVGSLFGWLKRNPDPVSAELRPWIRRFRKALLEVAKKNGKTLLAAGIGLLLAFFDDEPAAEVYSAATKKDQAKLLWTDGDQMVDRSPPLKRRIARSAKSLYDKTTGSSFKPISAEEGGEEGINPHAVIVDELHRHKTRGLVDMLSQSFGARLQPLLLEITTAGDEGDDSIWSEEHNLGVQVLEGTVKDESAFVAIYTIDDGDDPFDEAVWPKANPNLGVSVKLDDLRSASSSAQAAPGKLPGYLRFRMNRRARKTSRYFNMDVWHANSAELELMEGADAWGGLDLGWSDDLSGFALWIPRSDGRFDWKPLIWAPEYGAWRQRSPEIRAMYEQWAEHGFLKLTDGNVRDDDAIYEDILEAVRPFTLRRLKFDKAYGSSLVPRLVRAGMEAEPLGQTLMHMSEPMKELERILLALKVCHADHPVLAWMAANLEVRGDDNGNLRPSKPSRNSGLKIDGISAGLDAIAGWIEDERDIEEEFTSIWELPVKDGGVRSLTI